MSDGSLEVHVGLDDTDTDLGGCTTHLTFRILSKVLSEFPEAFFPDYPSLIRLNPAIPFKTRGNAATSFTLRIPESSLDNLRKLIVTEFLKYLEVVEGGGVEPGLIFLYGSIPDELGKLYKKALTDYVHRDYITKIINRFCEYIEIPLGYSRGLVGALAAIGASGTLTECTYEILVYRTKNNYLRERCVEEDSIKVMDKIFRDQTFLNYDYENNKPLIMPSGQNPVLLGIRGEDPATLVRALKTLNLCESLEGWLVYKTNQALNAHHVERRVEEFRPYQTGCVKGKIVEKPSIRPGGDVLLKLKSLESDHTIWVVFFGETGLGKIARYLIEGDIIRVCGGGKWWEDLGLVVHGDLLEVVQLVSEVLRNPLCPLCGHRMKSAGRGKGWKCPACGYRSSTLNKEKTKINREITAGIYRPVDSAVKHLVMPSSRIGRRSACNKQLISEWIYVYKDRSISS
ncbi:MAG: TiaS agmantine-binding domain-containing protein [Thermoprotei archaeon]